MTSELKLKRIQGIDLFRSAAQSSDFVSPQEINYQFETRFYILFLLVIATYFIASSIGSGWALFLTASMLGLCILSVALPVLVLKSLSAHMTGPELLSAGDEIPLNVVFRSRKGMAVLRRWLILKAEPEPGTYFSESDRAEGALFIELPQNAVTLRCPGLKRGIRPLPQLTVESSFPFGLVWCKASFQSPQKIAILPRKESVEGRFLFRLRSCTYVPGESRNQSNGLQNSSSTRGIRAYNRGDSRRFIHWGSSARHGSLMVREFEREGLPAFDIVFDRSCLWANSEQFEMAISAAASLLHLGHSLGVHPELLFLEPTGELSGKSQDIDQQLLLLAALEFTKAKEKSAADKQINSSPFEGRDRAVIMISPLALKTETKGSSNAEPQGIYTSIAESSHSRSSVFAIRVNPLLGTTVHAAADQEFILSRREDFSEL